MFLNFGNSYADRVQRRYEDGECEIDDVFHAHAWEEAAKVRGAEPELFLGAIGTAAVYSIIGVGTAGMVATLGAAGLTCWAIWRQWQKQDAAWDAVNSGNYAEVLPDTLKQVWKGIVECREISDLSLPDWEDPESERFTPPQQATEQSKAEAPAEAAEPSENACNPSPWETPATPVEPPQLKPDMPAVRPEIVAALSALLERQGGHALMRELAQVTEQHYGFERRAIAAALLWMIGSPLYNRVGDFIESVREEVEESIASPEIVPTPAPTEPESIPEPEVEADPLAGFGEMERKHADLMLRYVDRGFDLRKVKRLMSGGSIGLTSAETEKLWSRLVDAGLIQEQE